MSTDAALRAAIWEALQPKLREAGYSPEATPLSWEDFKATVESAVPALPESDDIPAPEQPTEDVPY